MMTFGQAVQNMAVMSIPTAIYLLVMRWRVRLAVPEILMRIGLVAGARRAYLFAFAGALPAAVAAILVSEWTSKFEGSMIRPFLGAVPTPSIVSAALMYGVIATGFPEELLFRGLIAGALFRRLSFWTANLVQALIFMLPHLLIVLVAPQLWPLAILLPLALGLFSGWLRVSSGSIGPGVVVHAVSNCAGALWVLNWRYSFSRYL